MEASIAENLENTLIANEEIRQKAELFLQNAKKGKEYPVHLLNLMEKAGNPHVRLAAAISYKNAVKNGDEMTLVCIRRHKLC